MKESKYNSYDNLPLFLNVKRGPCGNAKRFRGERRNSGMSEPCRKRQGEGYGACDDEVAKVLGVSPSSGYELMRVVANSASFAPAQGPGLIRSVAPPFPTHTLRICAGTPLGFPTLRIGSRMVVPKEKFVQWVEEHTAGGGGEGENTALLWAGLAVTQDAIGSLCRMKCGSTSSGPQNS